MTGNYKYIDHTADIAVEVSAENYEDLFIVSAQAWRDSVVDEHGFDNLQEKVLEFNDNSIEELLVHFLSELNYLLLGSKWITTGVKQIKIIKIEKEWNLRIVILGIPFDTQKYNIKIEIKAVTFHQMDVKYKDGKFLTRIVFDI
ncbi:MAG: archease [Bacteroidetes bacterium]|nr:archease [Bacteroidota bacterium]